MTNTGKPLLTIVIPCYNAEKYLDRCFRCLEDLDADEIEVLFVNDGSADATEARLKAWMGKRTNARLFSKENGGYSSAINAGLDHCRTDYVMFMGVDDEIVPQGLRRVCAQLRENRPDLLAFTTVKYYDDVRGEIRCETDSMTRYRNEGFLRTDLLALCRQDQERVWILFSRDTSRCFKTSVIGDLRYFGKTGISADGCFSSLVACRAKSFEFVNETCYYWHLHSDSVSGKEKSVKILTEEADVWKSYLSALPEALPARWLPDPVIYQFIAYHAVIAALRKAGIQTAVREHAACARRFVRWALKNCDLSWRSRFKLMFPELYLRLPNNKPFLSQE